MDTSALAHPKDPDATRKKRSKQKAKQHAFREAVWRRDCGMDRATGIRLSPDGPISVQGNCCHLQSRGAHPERKYDVSNAILMSALNHILSDHRGGRLLRLTDPETGEPAINGDKPIRFTLYNAKGQVLWTRTS